ncbi:MAG TPA: hypothetical protein VHO48_16465, partial [Anaerolineaceae bacterium]|nr:hypothetical protein [Anaerolineaceae bacterium]
MNTILSSKRNHIIHAVCLAVFVIMVVVTVWQIGGSATVAMTNNLGMAVFEVLTVVLALVYWKTISNRKEASQIWLLLSLGFLCSVVADSIWIFYNLKGIEAPYPSVADPLWVLGYLFQLAALVNRNRLLGVWPGKKQIALVLAIALVSFVLLFAFVLSPMLDETGTTRAIETLFNFSYPIIDFLILIAACFLVVSMWKGQLSITWNVIAFGFLVQSLADIFFIDASWKGLYYPNDTVNLISCLIDIAYGVGCMAIVVGVSLRQAA